MFKTNFINKFFSVLLSSVVFVLPLLSFLSLISVAPVAAASPKMEFTNTVDKAEANRGDTLSYTLTVKNTGDTDLTNVQVWINQPNLATYVAGSGSYQGFPGGQLRDLTDAWVADSVNLGPIPVGKYIVLKYQTKIASNANHNDIVWSVGFAKSDQTAKLQANSFTKVIFANPGLCAEKSADRQSVSPGDVVTFTISVCNQGNVTLHNIYIGDNINMPFEYVKGSTTLSVTGEQTINITDNWINDNVNIGPLNPDQKAKLVFKVKVTDSVKDGVVYQNVAQVKSDETPDILQCAVTLKGKVLGTVTQPKPETPKEQPKTPQTLPNTGPTDFLIWGLPALAPIGYLVKRFKTKI